jgi:hypothetical protein
MGFCYDSIVYDSLLFVYFFKYSQGAIYHGVPGEILCYSAWDKRTAYSKERFEFGLQRDFSLVMVGGVLGRLVMLVPATLGLLILQLVLCEL